MQLKVSAPGRICLFGEHLDYLNLPVITAAINLRIEIKGNKRDDNIFNFNLPDLHSTDSFQLGDELKYMNERDYLRSAVNVVQRSGAKIPCGYDCTIRGDIPINSGTSSSSALTVAWIKFLLEISADKRAGSSMEIARLAHQAEVLEFNEPGGQMDHYACSFGGVLYIDFWEQVQVQEMDPDIGFFVLGNSLESKNTKQVLTRVKSSILGILEKIASQNDVLDLRTIKFKKLANKRNRLAQSEIELLTGVLDNRDLTDRACLIFDEEKFNTKKLGALLNQTQTVLRDNLKISTAKIDNMIEAAISAGALGGKINGSGGGGCMFVAVPDNEKKIKNIIEAINGVGGKANLIRVDHGVRTDFIVHS